MPKSPSKPTSKAPRKKAPAKRPARPAAKKPAAPAKPITNYHTAVKFLSDRVNIERTRAQRVDPEIFKLDRMRKLMDALGNPEQSIRTVHIAGTNGKGSCVAMLTAALRNNGYTVGTFTSPHLTDLRERIQINNTFIPHALFTELMTRIAEAKVPKKYGEPTYFEVLTALSLLYFAEQAVDVAIIETGLGGRLDATNIVNPEVTAITAISMDHEHFLGNTTAAIAREKAGIFKPGAAALTFRQDPEIIETMREAATEAGTELRVVGADIEFSYRFEASPQLGPHTRVGLSTERCTFEHVPVPLKGEHQALNCGLVLAIIDQLVARGLELRENTVIKGLVNTVLPGRMEIVSTQPRVLIDGAHNPAALESLIHSIGAHIPYDSLILIFGCSSDKDVDALLRKVAFGGDKVIFTKARGTARAMEPDELAARFVEISPKMCQVAQNLEEALSIAKRASAREDLVCVTGSFFLVGEARKLLTDLSAKAAAQG
jgi:dihydrofolate synthase/folylpolyglutamate synthase